MRYKELEGDDIRGAREILIGRYMAGYCVAWAIARKRSLDSHELVGIWRGPELMHAGTRINDQTYFDVRGKISMGEFVQGWGGCTLRTNTEKELLVADPKITEDDIDLALFHLELLYPEHTPLYPLSRRRRRLDVFVRELENLSKAHGIYLRSDLPKGKTIIAYEAYGDEKGYEINWTLTGSAFLDRIL